MMNKRVDHTLFPIQKISLVAKKESWRKEISRPIYHIHKWWAQRLGSIFRALILYLADEKNGSVWDSFYQKHHLENIVVLDPFMGSGTTLGEALKLGAKAIGCDINPISSFLVKQELTRVSLPKLYNEYNKLEEVVAPKIKKYYHTKDPETGRERPVLYYFWVKLVTTPDGEDIPLFSRYVFAQNAYASKKPAASILCPHCWGVFRGKYNDISVVCPHCNYKFNPQKGPAQKTTVIDSTGKVFKIKDLVPKDKPLKEKMYALLTLNLEGEKEYRAVTNYDLELFKLASKELEEQVDLPLPIYTVRPGFNTNQARGYGYLHWRDFFNNRQLLCLGILLKEIQKISDKEIREQLLCLFSSTLEYNNIFCSYKGEGTGAVRPIFSNHILKPERTPLENSIWGYSCSSGCFSSLFRSKLLKAKLYLDEPFELYLDDNTQICKKIIASYPMHPKIVDTWEELNKSKNGVLILNGDSANLPLPDHVIDFIVTDPPYFDFIHYSELSDFFYAWLSPVLKNNYSSFKSETSGRDNEVQQTDANLFSNLLGKVFSEAYRVCKADGKLAFSFHHSRPEGWVSIANAIISSEYYIDKIFPVYAELMASTPKSSAKEPISIDAMIICGKKYSYFNDDDILDTIDSCINEIKYDKLSKSDVFVICAAQSIRHCVNERFTDKESYLFIDKIYRKVIMNIIN